MNSLILYTKITFEETLDTVLSSYIEEFGERKFKSVFDKTMNSNKIASLIKVASLNKVPPTSKELLYCINTIPYFIFSRGQTQAVAAIIALKIWYDKTHETFPSDYFKIQAELINISINIVEILESTFFK
jgi:hypothetical protein